MLVIVVPSSSLHVTSSSLLGLQIVPSIVDPLKYCQFNIMHSGNVNPLCNSQVQFRLCGFVGHCEWFFLFGITDGFGILFSLFQIFVVCVYFLEQKYQLFHCNTIWRSTADRSRADLPKLFPHLNFIVHPLPDECSFDQRNCLKFQKSKGTGRIQLYYRNAPPLPTTGLVSRLVSSSAITNRHNNSTTWSAIAVPCCAFNTYHFIFTFWWRWWCHSLLSGAFQCKMSSRGLHLCEFPYFSDSDPFLPNMVESGLHFCPGIASVCINHFFCN